MPRMISYSQNGISLHIGPMKYYSLSLLPLSLRFSRCLPILYTSMKCSRLFLSSTSSTASQVVSFLTTFVKSVCNADSTATLCAVPWQEQPSVRADGRNASQLPALRSTGRNDYHPCKEWTARRCRQDSGWRSSFEQLITSQSLFEGYTKR